MYLCDTKDLVGQELGFKYTKNTANKIQTKSEEIVWLKYLRKTVFTRKILRQIVAQIEVRLWKISGTTISFKIRFR